MLGEHCVEKCWSLLEEQWAGRKAGPLLPPKLGAPQLTAGPANPALLPGLDQFGFLHFNISVFLYFYGSPMIQHDNQYLYTVHCVWHWESIENISTLNSAIVFCPFPENVHLISNWNHFPISVFHKNPRCRLGRTSLWQQMFTCCVCIASECIDITFCVLCKHLIIPVQ